MILQKKQLTGKLTARQKSNGEKLFMKVVLIGKGEMLANLIEGALEAKAQIAGVFRYERTVLSPFKLFLYDLFKTSHDLTLIKKYKLHEIKCKSANCEKFRRELLRLNTDIMFVGTWSEKLGKQTFAIPRIASINVHPSLLPAYRGPNPYLQTIKHMEKYSGITLHLIDENFDTGAVLAQKRIEILPDDTGKELRSKTVFAARLLTVEVLKRLEFNIIKPIKQDECKASYYPNISEEEMMLDFTQKTAEEIHAHIRALHPWLPCYVTIGKRFYRTNPYKLKIIETITEPAGTIIEKNLKANIVTIACKNKKALQLGGLKLYRGFI